MARTRIVVFTDRRIHVGRHLAAAFVAAAAARDDVEIAAVVDTAPVPFSGATAARELAERIARRAFDPAHPLVARPVFDTLGTLLRRRGIRELVPPRRDVNDAAFVAQTLPALGADHALSLVCLAVFAAPLRSAFRRIVNYHNGALPAYRGLNATAWSVYRGDATSAFSYHCLTAGLDEGDVLLTQAVPVAPAASVAAIEWAKTQRAAGAAPAVLEALLAGKPGMPQCGSVGYYGRAALRALRNVGDPAQQPWDELQARIRAFGRVRLRIRGRDVDATRLRRAGTRARRPQLAFVTSDGVAAEVDRIRFLPPSLAALAGTAPEG
jgi:methionyl-tRNA formyltransferase